MSEQEPKDNKEPEESESLKDRPYSGDFRNFARRHCIARLVGNNLFRLTFFTFLFCTPHGWELLKNPFIRNSIFRREGWVGLLEDSILSPSLYHPNREKTSLEQSSADAGRWIAYDFYRPQEFGKSIPFERQRREGRLMLFSLDEVQGNSADTYTPTPLINILSIEHFLTLDFPRLEDIIKEGFLKETTYREAYDKVGLWEKYRVALTLSNMADEKIYTVTPKGNTLVTLDRDFGKKQQDPKKAVQLRPVFDF